MKHLKKLTVFFVLVCLFAAIAIQAAAAPKLDVSDSTNGITNYKNQDFESSTQDNVAANLGTGGSFATYYDRTLCTEENGNKYVLITPKSAGVAAKSSSISKVLFGDAETPILNYDYITLDLDIMSPELSKTSGLPNYPGADEGDGSSYTFYFAFSTANPSPVWANTYFYTVRNNGRYYLSADQKYDESDIEFSSEAGVWNHLTVVIEVNHTSASDTLAHVFFNGQYLAAFKHFEGKTVTANTAYTGGFYIYMQKVDTVVNDFKLALDNISANYYKKGYSAEGYGIDDYFDSFNPEKPLEYCEDTVWSKSYSYENTANPHPYTVDGVDYYMASAAAENVHTGSVITVKKDTSYFCPGGAELPSSFTVILENGASFELDPALEDKYVAVDVDAQSVTYKFPSDNDVYPCIWLDSDGSVLYDAEDLLIGSTPTKEAPLVSTGFDLSTGKYTKFNKWMWDTNNDGTLEDIGPLDNIEDIRLAYGGKPIVIKAVYGNSQAIWSVSKNGVVAGNDYSIYGTADAIGATVSAAESGSLFKLYDLTEMSCLDKITVGQNKTLTVDLNGCTLAQSGKGNNWNAVIFEVGDGASLTIGSSKAGAEIIQSHFHTGDKYNYPASYGMIRTTQDARSCDVTINGENLSVYCGTMVSLVSTAIANVVDNTVVKESDGDPISFTINGGSYYSILPLSYAMFALRTFDIDLTINDAFIYSNSGAIFTTDTRYYNAGSTLEVNNSTLASYKNGINSLFSQWLSDNEDLESISASFDSCTIIAQRRDSTTVGSPIIFKDVKIVEGSIINKQSGLTNADGYTTSIYSEDISFTASYPTIIYESDNSTPVPGTYELIDHDLTFKLDKIVCENSRVATVIWEKADGTSITEHYYASTTATAVAPSLSAYDPNNGWYKLEYAGWNTDDLTVKAGETTTFTPVLTPVASISGVKYNLGLKSNFYMNLYVPSEVTDGVEFNGFYSDEALEKKIESGVSTYTIGETSYNTLTFAISNSDIETDSVYYASINVKIGGESYVLGYEICVDLIGYCNAVLNSYECASEEASLVANLVRYSNEAYKLANETDSEAATALLTAHASCGCLGSTDVSEAELGNTETLSDYIKALAYNVTSANPGVTVYLLSDKASEVTSIEIAYDGIADGYKGSNDVTCTFVAGNSTVIEGTDVISYNYNGIAAYDVTAVMTVTVYGAEGTVLASGSYSIANYITSNPDSAIAKSLFAFATAARNYKLN